ncbi:hypothetical protein ES703_33285 [subsurface metagenome]
MGKAANVIVGTLFYRAGAYIIDKFLANQKEIQQNYPSSELVFATVEDDFIEELERLLSFYGLRGKVILYETVKPDYARNRIWNTTCGREAMRQYVLFRTEASHLLFLDADMTYDPLVIKIMEQESQGYDVVFSGYAGRDFGISTAGVGCSMLHRSTLEKLKFRCYEFKNGDVIDEGVTLEMDLTKLGQRVRKGFFLSICHYTNECEARCIDPQPMGLFRKITNSSLFRYVLIRASIVTRHDISGRLQFLVYNFPFRLRRFPGHCLNRLEK